MLTLRAITVLVARALVVSHNAASDHAESAGVLALSGDLLNTLVLSWHARIACSSLPTRRQSDNASSRLHRTHGQL